MLDSLTDARVQIDLLVNNAGAFYWKVASARSASMGSCGLDA
jgi:hypothetical protein